MGVETVEATEIGCCPQASTMRVMTIHGPAAAYASGGTTSTIASTPETGPDGLPDAVALGSELSSVAMIAITAGADRTRRESPSTQDPSWDPPWPPPPPSPHDARAEASWTPHSGGLGWPEPTSEPCRVSAVSGGACPGYRERYRTHGHRGACGLWACQQLSREPALLWLLRGVDHAAGRLQGRLLGPLAPHPPMQPKGRHASSSSPQKALSSVLDLEATPGAERYPSTPMLLLSITLLPRSEDLVIYLMHGMFCRCRR